MGLFFSDQDELSGYRERLVAAFEAGVTRNPAGPEYAASLIPLEHWKGLKAMSGGVVRADLAGWVNRHAGESLENFELGASCAAVTAREFLRRTECYRRVPLERGAVEVLNEALRELLVHPYDPELLLRAALASAIPEWVPAEVRNRMVEVVGNFLRLKDLNSGHVALMAAAAHLCALETDPSPAECCPDEVMAIMHRFSSRLDEEARVFGNAPSGSAAPLSCHFLLLAARHARALGQMEDATGLGEIAASLIPGAGDHRAPADLVFWATGIRPQKWECGETDSEFM